MDDRQKIDFEGDGAHNHYRATYEKTGETWDWSYTDPASRRAYNEM